MFNFDNIYKTLPSSLFTIQDPIPVKKPKLIIKNRELIKELGVDNIDFTQTLSGNKIPNGAEPIAQAYSGHQFGHLNTLGDGRAILLGEHVLSSGQRFDIQLKGSGRTPYSRGGDGRATLYSMLREYLISYAMEKLNIPTTRSLAVVSTGEDVYRDMAEMGGILTRVASSHIRVGTFQYVAMLGNLETLKIFTDYVINRHYPELKSDINPYLALLKNVMNKQIDLIVDWYRVGFIHGVMNTDNVSICGETIDYGPCAFMDIYNPKTVFSSIDRFGRYSFENQKNIGGWNMARFAETLIPLVDNNQDVSLSLINEVLSEYKALFEDRWNVMMASKIGISNPTDSDFQLISSLLNIMEDNRLDYTKTFRNLILKDEPLLKDWYKKWELRDINKDLIIESNPAIIPRNFIVEHVLKEAATYNNLNPLNDFLEVLENPYSDDVLDYYKNPPERVDENYKTFCGT
ncbi:YdiU family protein [Thiospirochaeta perfilievii]|uniref:Protein nucleotidyltransferase YdiU n=1 Tax=Thiospirochaeta perfilievii TaxID=252967 RepID=A0A5C1QAY9_9SPIO|nr:YdiU family protein [Thiospirochaeta perfilievii]QEN03966.1 YdiU family protein [Thiospirochaeta perfilievii]